MSLLQFGSCDPYLSVGGYVLSGLVQYLTSILIGLQFGKGKPQLGGGGGEGREGRGGGEGRGGEGEWRGEGGAEGRGGEGRGGETHSQ